MGHISLCVQKAFHIATCYTASFWVVESTLATVVLAEGLFDKNDTQNLVNKLALSL